MNNDKENNELDQLVLQMMSPIQKKSQNSSNQKEHKISIYNFSSAVEAFECNNLKDTMFYLHNFTRVSLNDFYKYTIDFDESKFSNHLINFIDSSSSIEILYSTLDIFINLTHYESELTFLLSLIQRDLYNKLNYLLQNPIDAHIYRKIFTLLSNIALSTKENRDELLSNIDFSFLVDPKYDQFYCLKSVFSFMSKLFYFPLNNEMQINLFNLVFPYLYNRCKEDDWLNYKYFITFLYNVENHFYEQFFEYYLLENDTFSDIILYFSDFLAIKPKTKIMILSLFHYFLPMKPQFFKSLSPCILKYIELKATTTTNAALDNELNNGYSLLMNQLFLKYKDLFQIEELQQILIFLLKYENNVPPKLKRQIGFIAFHLIPSFPPFFSHSNLNILFNSCNDWFKSESNDLLINTINLVIIIQKNEDLFEESSNFLCYFVEQNLKLLNHIVEDNDINKNLKEFASVILHCFNELNDES